MNNIPTSTVLCSNKPIDSSNYKNLVVGDLEFEIVHSIIYEAKVTIEPTPQNGQMSVTGAKPTFNTVLGKVYCKGNLPISELGKTVKIEAEEGNLLTLYNMNLMKIEEDVERYNGAKWRLRFGFAK